MAADASITDRTRGWGHSATTGIDYSQTAVDSTIRDPTTTWTNTPVQNLSNPQTSLMGSFPGRTNDFGHSHSSITIDGLTFTLTSGYYDSLPYTVTATQSYGDSWYVLYGDLVDRTGDFGHTNGGAVTSNNVSHNLHD